MSTAGRTRQGIAKQIEVTDVPGSLIDHVNKDPAKVDRSSPERRNRCNVIQRFTLRNHFPTALAGGHVEADDL